MTSSPPRFHSRCRSGYWLALLTALIGGWMIGSSAQAQIDVYISVSRRSYILYEPLPATITITNNAGRDLTIEDAGSKQWLNLEITTLDGMLLTPYDPDYKLHSLHIAAGQTLQRSIDLTPLFPIREMGTHRVRVSVYLAEFDRYFYSNYASFDLTDGKTIWQKTVGVPGSDEVREISILTHELPDKLLLYARIRQLDGNTVYTTQSLGSVLTTGREPLEMLDSHNNLHVLQEAKPGAFRYTIIGLDGQRLTQEAYTKTGVKPPILAKVADGEVEVHGGQIQVAPAKGVGPPPQPKLSDRPAAVPTPIKKDGF
jgi:hypothetical protein